MEKIFKPRVEKIIQLCEIFNIKKDLIIEVGSASGMFTEVMKNNGAFKRIIGIEPGAAQAETSRNVGVEIIESILEEVTEKDLNQKANVVVSFETIEHVFSPSLFIQRSREILLDGGFLVLTCPNYEGFDISILGIESESLDAEHINLFNPKSIKILLEKNNFEIIEIDTPGNLDAEIVRSKIIDNTLDISSNNFFKKILIDEWSYYGDRFQEFLKKNLLSSHMWVVARKKND